jgi:hypothetical protein
VPRPRKNDTGKVTLALTIDQDIKEMALTKHSNLSEFINNLLAVDLQMKDKGQEPNADLIEGQTERITEMVTILSNMRVELDKTKRNLEKAQRERDTYKLKLDSIPKNRETWLRVLQEKNQKIKELGGGAERVIGDGIRVIKEGDPYKTKKGIGE